MSVVSNVYDIWRWCMKLIRPLFLPQMEIIILLKYEDLLCMNVYVVRVAYFYLLVFFCFLFINRFVLLHEIYVNKVEHLWLRNANWLSAIYSTGRMCISVCKSLNEINDNLMKWYCFKNRPSTSASFRVSSQPMKILEIPPYRKNQLNQNPTAIVNPSPPRVSDIPTFKPRKSNDWQPAPMDNSNQEFQQLHIPAAMNSDLVRRLKNSESTVHRSIDCIAAGNKSENRPATSLALKIAPSLSNVAQRSESITSTTGATQSIGSKKSSIDDETKGNLQFKSAVYVRLLINILYFCHFRLK